MLDSKSKRRQDERSSKGQQCGQWVDDQGQAKQLDQSFAGKPLGYTRTGQVYLVQESQREYTY